MLWLYPTGCNPLTAASSLKRPSHLEHYVCTIFPSNRLPLLLVFLIALCTELLFSSERQLLLQFFLPFLTLYSFLSPLLLISTTSLFQYKLTEKIACSYFIYVRIYASRSLNFACTSQFSFYLSHCFLLTECEEITTTFIIEIGSHVARLGHEKIVRLRETSHEPNVNRRLLIAAFRRATL